MSFRGVLFDEFCNWLNFEMGLMGSLEPRNHVFFETGPTYMLFSTARCLVVTH